MYAGKSQAKINEEKLRRKREAAKAEQEKNALLVRIDRCRSKIRMIGFRAVSTSLPKSIKMRSNLTPNSEISSVICARNSM